MSWAEGGGGQNMCDGCDQCLDAFTRAQSGLSHCFADQQWRATLLGFESNLKSRLESKLESNLQRGATMSPCQIAHPP